ncbi:Hypothetical predicted protein [Mytilus galloprovincialis]|uniref:Uncharacterized protein n=1 Tax=Mytilus galloprovincialis TaxID=29158 RepID=A0A8B6CS58_MYTGA|nr:Hypothetical predicted protein [Mytilus galloprovincialis]
MSKSDFILWDDDLNSYDLDILLGEYTDNELFVNSDSEDNTYDHRVTNSASNLSKEKSNKIDVKRKENTDGQCNFSTTYDTIFHTAYIDTADSIISDPIQNLFGDSAITEITKQCKTNNEVEQFFQS